MRKMNNKGSVLCITLALVLVFLLLGLATINNAGMQSLDAERRQASGEAFWLADAGVEVARSKLTEATPDLIEPDADCRENPADSDYPECNDSESYNALPNGDYHVFSEQDPDCPTCIDRWHIRSWGTNYIYGSDGGTREIRRGIDAIVGKYDVANAITTHGTVNGSCVEGGDATIIGNCEAHASFTFADVFGVNYSDLITFAEANPIDPTHPAYDAAATPPVVNHAFHLSSPSQTYEYNGVTVTFLEGNLGKLTVNTEDPYAGPAVLIVDSTGTNSPQAEIKVDGNVGFCGIIWSIGEAKITGTATVNGAIFIDGDPAEDNDVLGTPNITFDPNCVDQVLGFLPGGKRLLSWKEYAPDPGL